MTEVEVDWPVQVSCLSVQISIQLVANDTGYGRVERNLG